MNEIIKKINEQQRKSEEEKAKQNEEIKRRKKLKEENDKKRNIKEQKEKELKLKDEILIKKSKEELKNNNKKGKEKDEKALKEEEERLRSEKRMKFMEQMKEKQRKEQEEKEKKKKEDENIRIEKLKKNYEIYLDKKTKEEEGEKKKEQEIKKQLEAENNLKSQQKTKNFEKSERIRLENEFKKKEEEKLKILKEEKRKEEEAKIRYDIFQKKEKEKEEEKKKKEQEIKQLKEEEFNRIQKAEQERIQKEEEKNKKEQEEIRILREERRKQAEEEEKRIKEQRERKIEEDRKLFLEQQEKAINAFKNYSENKNLKLLNNSNIKKIYGEKSKELTNDKILHMLDRKINNCEINEKLNLKITLKKPKKEYLYEAEIYDDENKLISKTEQKSENDEITLIDNSEIFHKFTKTQSITLVLIKHINSLEQIRTVKLLNLNKIISNNNNENFEENVDNFKDNELINVAINIPKEKENDKIIELNFNTEENGDNDYNIFYSIQKNDNILFKSPVCKASYLKKSDKIKLKDLEPEFEISFYNEEYEEKKIKIKTEDLKNGVIENIDLINSNNLKVKITSEEKESNNFIKLLKKGLNLDLSIAIDFTGSNGDPNFENSLHYINNGFINNYEKAIRENIKIISMYNKSDKYDVYGFGADLDGEFKAIFNLNRTDSPSVQGIENVIRKYKETVNSVYFSGGTYFAPIIKEIKRKVELNHNNNFNYHILLIISDGYIHDIQETINSIIEASKYPISFIIIGVGADVNYDMKVLNGENGKLVSSSGELLNKDNVQYVHFNDYADDLNKLTEAVLKYIPDQISDYYKDKI